jgi:hypothetical protein
MQVSLLPHRTTSVTLGHAVCRTDEQHGPQSPGHCSCGSRFCQALLPAALLGVFNGGKTRLGDPVGSPVLHVGASQAACFGGPQIAARLWPATMMPRLAPHQAASFLSWACGQVSVLSTAPRSQPSSKCCTTLILDVVYYELTECQVSRVRGTSIRWIWCPACLKGICRLLLLQCSGNLSGHLKVVRVTVRLNNVARGYCMTMLPVMLRM